MKRLALAAALLAALASATPAAASPNGVVISEFQTRGAAGGNDDFVEIRNTTAAPVVIGGFGLAGCNAAGTIGVRATVPAGTTLPAGATYLFRNAAVPGEEDVSYTSGITDTGGARLLDAAGAIVDQAGSAGSNPCREGAGLMLPATGTATAFERKAGGTQDTGDNAADFDGPADADPQPCGAPCGAPPEDPITRISAIQGAGASSPRTGQTVTIEGVVTGVDDEIGSDFERTYPADAGIFVQEEATDVDADPATSEGIYVGFVRFRGNYPPGTRVRVNGRVVEQFGETRIEETINQEPEIIGTAPVPEPVTIDPAAAAAQDPATRPYYERLEGMRVRLAEGTATVGGTSKFGELFLSPGIHQAPADRVFRTESAPDLLAADSDAGAGDPSNPLIDTDSTTYTEGDLFDVVQDLVGPLAFAFSNFRILNQPGLAPTVVPHPAAPYPFEGIAPAAADQLRFATFNVENFFPVGAETDRHVITQEEYEAKRDDIAAALRDRLERPDVIALQEVVDKTIADDLAAVLGGYTAYLEEGNDGRGIDVAFLIRDTVDASNLRQLGKTATNPTSATCSEVPGGLFDRPPLAIDVEKAGVRFTAISNHFSSKSAPDACRGAQAAFVRDEVVTIEAAGGEAIVAGDLNSFEDELALQVLEGPQTSLDNLWDEAPEHERYSFQFQGRLQTLDHVLVTDGLAPRVLDARYVHIDNDYFDRRTVDGHDASDHDPMLVTLDLPAAPQVVLRPVALRLGLLAVGFPGVFAADEGAIAYRYQWLRCATRDAAACTPIAGADRLVELIWPRGGHLRLQVTATSQGGETIAVSPPVRG